MAFSKITPVSSSSLKHSASTKASVTLPIIGWRERVALPQLNIEQIKAKIDTGARSSALHAFKIEEFELNNKLMIRFQVHPRQRDNKYIVMAEAELLEYRKVTSSGGHAQIRPVILTTVQLGMKQWPIELTLTNRDVMGFRMLLGRQALRAPRSGSLRDRFVIDPGKSFLQSNKHLQK